MQRRQWHVVPLAQVGRSPGGIAWWSVGTVALRGLCIWLDSNTGSRVFVAAVFHATGNFSHMGPFLDWARQLRSPSSGEVWV